MPIDNTPPLVSIIIPTKDRADSLRRAMASAGAQTYPHVEVLVVDDGSTECLDSVFDEFRLKYPYVNLIIHKNDVPKGGGYCRRLGTELASGELVCFLDDDDLYLKNKLDILGAYLQRNPNVDAVFGRVIIREGGDRLIEYRHYRMPLSGHLAEVCQLQTNGSLIRRHALEKANFNPNLKKYQDTQFHIELCKKTLAHLIEEPVAVWHKSHSPTQVSFVQGKERLASIERFQALIDYLFSLEILSVEEKKFMLRKKLKYYAEYELYVDGLKFLRKSNTFNLCLYLTYCVYYRFRMDRLRKIVCSKSITGRQDQ